VDKRQGIERSQSSWSTPFFSPQLRVTVSSARRGPTRLTLGIHFLWIDGALTHHIGRRCASWCWPRGAGPPRYSRAFEWWICGQSDLDQGKQRNLPVCGCLRVTVGKSARAVDCRNSAVGKRDTGAGDRGPHLAAGDYL
jgi:hypothetical protein